MSLSNPINPPLVNEAVAKTASSGLAVDENQTKVNQIHGINPAGSTGAGIPKPVSSVSALIANASLGATSTINVCFQRDPSDNNFSRVVIYAKGYQGNNSPVQVGSSADSPATVILNNTGESVSLILQSVGNGGVSPIASSPTTAIKLPKNSNGGAGTQTTTNLTLGQIPPVPNATSALLIPVTAVPWEISNNPTLVIPLDGSTLPIVAPIIVLPGSTITIGYVKGGVIFSPGQPITTDLQGDPNSSGTGSVGGKFFPSHYVSGSTLNICGLVGAFTDITGVVIGTFDLSGGGTGRTFTVPFGAAKVQFGINDVDFGDNSGPGYTITVNVGTLADAPLTEQYAASVLANLPLAYYRQADAGTNMADSSGNNNNGLYPIAAPTQGVTSLIDSSLNAASTYNGTTQYGEGTVGTLDVTAGKYSVEFSIKMAALPSGTGQPASWRAASNTAHEAMGVQILNSGNVKVFWFSGGVYTFAQSSSTLSAGVKYLCTLSVNAGVFTLYINNTVFITGTMISPNGWNAPTVLRVGAGVDSSTFAFTEGFPGTVDDVSIFSIALTAAQVNTHYLAAQVPSLDASKITTGQLALARGGTNADLSGTGGTSQVLKQTSAGGAVTVGQLAASDLSNYVEGTFTPTFLNLTGSFTATGFYIRIGNLVWIEIKISPTTGSVVSTSNSTRCNNNPFTPLVDGVCFATDDAVGNFGNGWIRSSTNDIWLPSFNSPNNVYIAGQFRV